jgi:hypothetical protein
LEITNDILRVKEHHKNKKNADVNFLVSSSAVDRIVIGKILDELVIEPQLGATTLESLSLALNSFTRTLYPSGC